MFRDLKSRDTLPLKLCGKYTYVIHPTILVEVVALLPAQNKILAFQPFFSFEKHNFTA